MIRLLFAGLLAFAAGCGETPRGHEVEVKTGDGAARPAAPANGHATKIPMH